MTYDREETILRTFVAIAIAIVIALIILLVITIRYGYQIEQICTNHNGILVKTYHKDYVCINKNSVISAE